MPQGIYVFIHSFIHSCINSFILPWLTRKCCAVRWMTGPLANPSTRLHAGFFLPHVKRCFIRSVMPLQLTDGAIQEDRLLQSMGPYHPSDDLYDQSRFVIISKKKKIFQRNSEDYRGRGSRTDSLQC